MRARVFRAIDFKREPRRAFEISVNERGDKALGDGLVEHDVDVHPVGKRRDDDAVQRAADCEPAAVDRELA